MQLYTCMWVTGVKSVGGNITSPTKTDADAHYSFNCYVWTHTCAYTPVMLEHFYAHSIYKICIIYKDN